MPNKITSQELSEVLNDELLIVDARPTALFIDAFVSRSINIVFNHLFVQRLKMFFGSATEFILIAQENDIDDILKKIAETPLKLSGYITEGVDAWKKAELPLDMIIEADAYELGLDLKHDNKALVVDVREEGDYEMEHLTGANNMPLRNFADLLKISQFDESQNLYLHCNGGTRSVLACSILKKEGFHNIRNIQGGMKAIKEDNQLPLVVNKTNLN